MTLARQPGDAATDRRFEAIVCDWDGVAPPARTRDATRVRDLVEALCAAAVDVVFVTAGQALDIDDRLRARPRGPGRLLLVADRGAETYECNEAGLHLVQRGDATGVVAAAFATLWRDGIGPSLVLVAGDGIDPSNVPAGAARAPGDLDSFCRVLDDQLRRRRERAVPEADLAPGWSLVFEDVDHDRERVVEALLTVADGRTGTSGAPLLRHPSATPGVVVAGVYTGIGPDADLLPLPRWERLASPVAPGERMLRALDLHTGVLVEREHDGSVLRSARFSSLARPGTGLLRVEHRGAPVAAGPALVPAGDGEHQIATSARGDEYVVVPGVGAGVAAAATQTVTDTHVERIAVYERVDEAVTTPEHAFARLDIARDDGFDRLLHEHRRAWAQRWEDADIVVEGDDHLQLATRVGLYHLMASVPDHDEAAVGARGLSGHAYRGHVFWDTDVFVSPFLAATHPASARAILEYRIRRLPAARAAAWDEGRSGARFPWESATIGDDVTPRSVRDQTGRLVAIRTGELEVHIVADVAWAATNYVDWTGDRAFASGAGHRILVETARYWASRIRVARSGDAHVYGVIGPDEYHEPVDDNMFTNVMARWNLRRAAASAIEHGGVDAGERDHWLSLADALVLGHDASTGVYEQFAGFSALEPLMIADVAPRRPITADLLLGRARVVQSQVIKQPDVLMAHHLVPDELVPGSLVPNLDYYDPRTAHGSSLSPAIHASLFARAGRLRDAVHWLRVAADVDLGDVTGTTAGGLHVATMGGVWQALVWGFAGVRPRGDALVVDPRLPDEWDAYEVRVRFRGVPVRVRVARDGVRVVSAGPITVHAGNTDHHCGPDGLALPLPPLPDAASNATATNVPTLRGGAHAVRARRHR